MKNKNGTHRLKHVIVALGIIGLSCGLFMLFWHNDETKPIVSPNPFHVFVSDLKLAQVQRQVFDDTISVLADETEDRLVLTVSINNQTNMDFRNVRFELLLNEQVSPYIASDILTFTSDPMGVTNSSKAQALHITGQPLVCGFLHEWSMLLTAVDDLEEYYGLTPRGIAEALKSLTVNIWWDGGSQTQTLPLSLKA